MKLAAIICEYNPFHRGHALQLAETRKSGYDGIVCIMDGHLTQRGQFAALSKWDRAKAALLCGADAVVELPALLACRSADAFARAGVAIARALGAEALSFGCETDDLSLLRRAAAFQEDAVFRAHLEAQLARGVSFPRARGAALAACLKLSPEQAEALSRPNAILAMEYLRALAAPGSPAPLVVLRRGEYHSPELWPCASASALRAAALRGDEAGESALPDKARFQWPLLSARREIDDLFLWALRSGPGTGQMSAIHPGPAGPAGGPRPHRAHRRADPGPSRPGISAAAGGRKFPGIAGNRPPGDAAYAGRGPAAGKRGFPVRMPCDGSMGPHPHAAPGTAGRSGIHPALRPPMILRFWYILRPVRMNKARYFP